MNARRAGVPALAALTLILILAAAPVAADSHHGEAPPGPWTIEVEADALEEPVRPLTDFAEVALVVRAPCEAVEDRNLSLQVHLRVAHKPEWVQATVSPAAVYLRNGTCDGPVREAAARLLVQTSAESPAFNPANITVEATTPEERVRAGRGNATVTADYFSIIDATTPVPTMIVPPGARVEVPVTVTNFGNDATVVRLAVAQVDGGLRATLPPPTVLGATQQGDANNNGTVTVVVDAPADRGFMNTPGVVVLDVTSHHADNASLPGMDARVSLLITTKGVSVPGPGAIPLVALLAAAASTATIKRRIQKR